MGTLIYDGVGIEFDDRLLTHLHVVVMQRFRRGEGFPMSWLDALPSGDGRSSVWLTPNLPIYFKFSGSRVPTINQDWIDALTRSAISNRGLIVTNEDGSLARAGLVVPKGAVLWGRAL
jgi:hypothetical protein